MPRKSRSSLKFLNDRGKCGIVPLKYEAKVFGGQDKVAPNGRDWRIRYVKPSQKCYTTVEKWTKLPYLRTRNYVLFRARLVIYCMHTADTPNVLKKARNFVYVGSHNFCHAIKSRIEQSTPLCFSIYCHFCEK